MGRQVLIADRIQLDADPASHSHIRRFEECPRPGLDKPDLQARRRGDPYGDVPVIVMIACEHRIHLFSDKEGGFAVRKPFRRFGQRGADSAHPMQLYVAIHHSYNCG